MDKTLKLYNFPAAGSIVKVIAVSATAPSEYEVGDHYINISTNPAKLYLAITDGVTLSWMESRFVEGKYYILIENSTPSVCYYHSGTLTRNVQIGFPNSTDNNEIYSFSYSAARMGNAPSIQATFEHRDCFDDLWTDRTCVIFNDTLFFIDKKPSSQYSNESERYKHTIEFVSERKLLETVYFTNMVDYSSWVNDPVALETEFSFFGDISQIVTRLNESMKYSKLQKNGIGFSVAVDDDEYTSDFISSLEEPEQLIEISATTLKETLDMVFEKWEVPYYFDGYDIHIGFSNKPLMDDAGDAFPTFLYGIGNQILLTSKSQSNDIINRITGRGSSDNIPYYYPNETPNGIAAHYLRSGSEIQDAVDIVVPYRIASVIPSTTTTPNPDGDYIKYEEYEGTYNYDQSEFQYHISHIDVDDNGNIVNSNPPDNISLNVNNDAQYVYSGINGRNSYYVNGVFYKRFYARLNKHENDPNLITTTGISINENISTKGIAFVADSAYYNVYSNSKAAKFEAWIYSLTDPSQENWVYDPRIGTKVLDLSYTATVANGRRVFSWSDGTTTQTSPTSDGISEKFPIQITGQSYGDVLVFSTTVYVEDDFYTYEMSDAAYGHDIGDNINDTHDLQTKCQKGRKYLSEVTRTIITQTYEDTERWVWHGNIDNPYFLLSDIGLKLGNSIRPQTDDIIYFDSSDVLPSSASLLPSYYRDNDDVWIDAKNNTYIKSQNVYYYFENLYAFSNAHESIQDNEDIKPTITGVYNNESTPKRIDKIVAVDFDANDNNEKDENGNYYHPYFFVKLAKTSVSGGKGFNLFDCASDSGNMTMNMKSGLCGGCSFEIGVKNGSDGYAKNPIAVFEQATTINGVTYAAGTPYRDSNGDVKLSGAPYQDSQQDTEHNSVWIALKKDDSTFSPQVLPEGTMIPAANDEFVFTNINLPYAYVTAAEQRLTRYLLDTMEKENVRKYDYQIKLSSIFYKHSKEVLDRWLNEAAKILFVYDGNTYDYYVDSYTYNMNAESTLPEVSITLKEKIRTMKSKFRQLLVEQAAYKQTADKGTTSENGRLKSSSRDDSVRNLNVSGDININGVSLRSQIDYINSQTEKNRMDAENESVSMKSDAQIVRDLDNLFIDGLFLTDYNTFSDTSGSKEPLFRIAKGGYFGGNKLLMILPYDELIAIDTLIPIENVDHTITMAIKHENDGNVEIEQSVGQDSWEAHVLIYIHNSDKKIIDGIDNVITITDEYKNYAFKIPYNDNINAAYFSIGFANTSNNAFRASVNGIQAFAGDYTYEDADGNLCASSILPTRYYVGSREYEWLAKNTLKNKDAGKAKNGIIVLRAIPLDHAKYGERYFFAGGISVKSQNTDYDFDELEGWSSIYGSNGPVGWVCGRYMTDTPVLVTIPKNFNADSFLTNSSYIESLCQDASNLSTKDLASPYFEIVNGKVVCTKEVNVNFDKKTIQGKRLYYVIKYDNQGKYVRKWRISNNHDRSGYGRCHLRPAKTRKHDGIRSKWKYKMTSPALSLKGNLFEVVGISRRKISVKRIRINIIQRKNATPWIGTARWMKV